LLMNGPASTSGRAVRVRVWRRQDLVATPWRNGGGATYELAAEPLGASLDDFAWRISIAAVDADAPFSRYHDVDRIITLLNGGPMHLTVDGVAVDPQPLQPFGFPGEASVDCVVASPSHDLNVMTRRGLVAAALAVLTPGELVTLEPCWRRVLVVLEGQVEAASLLLHPWDGLVDATAEPLPVRGFGTVAAIALTPSS
jgi:uncharacterized protein